MKDYGAFIASAYGLSALVLAALAVWLVLDARARRRDLKALEEAGLRRRSDRAG